jgi:hypothetical protein
MGVTCMAALVALQCIHRNSALSKRTVEKLANVLVNFEPSQRSIRTSLQTFLTEGSRSLRDISA